MRLTIPTRRLTKSYHRRQVLGTLSLLIPILSAGQRPLIPYLKDQLYTMDEKTRRSRPYAERLRHRNNNGVYDSGATIAHRTTS